MMSQEGGATAGIGSNWKTLNEFQPITAALQIPIMKIVYMRHMCDICEK